MGTNAVTRSGSHEAPFGAKNDEGPLINAALDSIRENPTTANVQEQIKALKDEGVDTGNLLWNYQKSLRGEADAPKRFQDDVAQLRQQGLIGPRAESAMKARANVVVPGRSDGFDRGGARGGQKIPEVANALKTFGPLTSGESASRAIDAVKNSPGFKALSPQQQDQLTNGLWDAYKSAHLHATDADQARSSLESLDNRFGALQRSGALSKDTLSALKAFKDERHQSLKIVQPTAEQAQAEAATKQRILDSAQGTADKLQRIQDFRTKNNGWMMGSGLNGQNAELALRRLPDLKAAIARGDEEAASKIQKDAESFLKGFGSADPAQVLKDTDAESMRNLETISKVVGLVPGVGQPAKLMFKEAVDLIKYSKGDINKTQLFTNAFLNAVSGPLDKGIDGLGLEGPTGEAAKAVLGAVKDGAADFTKDAAKILSGPGTTEEKLKKLDGAMKKAIANAFVGAVEGQLKKLTGLMGPTDKKAVVDYLIKVAQKFGIDPAVNKQIEKLGE